MVAGTKRALQPKREGPPWIAAAISTVNILQFLVFGWLAIPANFLIYIAANGQIPSRQDPSTSSQLALWLGNMPLPVPWAYFLATSLIVLVIAVYAVPEKRRFATAERNFAYWRTTPGFLAVIAAVLGGTQIIVTNFYDTTQSLTSPYHYGTVVCLVAAAISFIAWRIAPGTAPSRKARPHA